MLYGRLKYAGIILFMALIFFQNTPVDAFGRNVKDNEKQKKINELYEKDVQVQQNRTNKIKLISEIKEKNNQIRGICIQLNSEKISSDQENEIREILQNIKNDLQTSKASVDDVRIVANKMKLNILNKNYIEADSNMDQIADIQNTRYQSLVKVNADLDKLLDYLKKVK